MGDDIKATVKVSRVAREFRAVIKAETTRGTESFGGRADSALGAIEDAIKWVRAEKRSSPKGRRPKRYDIALDLRSHWASK